MKKIFILSILFVISLVSCDDVSYTETQKRKNPETGVTYTTEGVTFHVVEIDSCEYLIGRKISGDYSFGYMSHKGNCKYCAERRKRELKNDK